MRIIPWVRFVNGMGTGPCLKQCADFLLLGAPSSFGSAVANIEIYAHCRSLGRTKIELVSMQEQFRARVLTLPNAWIRRKSKRIEIAYYSRMAYLKDMFGASKEPLTTEYFVAFCREFGATLPLIGKRLRPTDDFDVVALLAHVEQQLRSLPSDDSGVRLLQARLGM